jgi:hypothetical protein
VEEIIPLAVFFKTPDASPYMKKKSAEGFPVSYAKETCYVCTICFAQGL